MRRRGQRPRRWQGACPAAAAAQGSCSIAAMHPLHLPVPHAGSRTAACPTSLWVSDRNGEEGGAGRRPLAVVPWTTSLIC